MIRACLTCKWCHEAESGVFEEATCSKVTDPYTGSSWPVRIARQDTHLSFVLPCGFEGKLWTEKTD